MRSSFSREFFVSSLVCLRLWLGGFESFAIADDSAPEAADHPILVVTAASVDRLLERGALLSELAGGSLTKESLVAKAVQDGQSLLKGMDHTKPAGVMLFFSLDAVMRSGESPNNKTKPASDEDANDEQSENKADPPIDDYRAEADDEPETGVDAFFSGFEQVVDGLDTDRVVAFIPVSNFDDLIEAWKLTPVPDWPGLYQQTGSDEFVARRLGNYLLFGEDADLVDHCPDPRSLVRPLLGKHDMVVSFQAKGLPVGLRTLGAEAIKFGYAATLQQRDDEPKAEYELRRASGELLAELLDLALSHIDEVNCGLRIDSKQKQLVVELDVVGAENGKLAKFAKEWTPKRSHFSGLWQEDGPMSLGLSLAIPERHVKAINGAIKGFAQPVKAIDTEDLAEFSLLWKLAEKLIASGQLDLLMTSTGTNDDGNALLGIKVPGGPNFPEQFQQMLEQSTILKRNDVVFNTAVDAVNGIPIHTVRQNIFSKLFGEGVSVNDEKESQLSLAVTPDAIWMATSQAPNLQTVPDLLRLAIERPSSKATKPAGSTDRSIAPIRFMFHANAGRVSESHSDEADSKVLQAKGDAGDKVRQIQFEQAEREKKEQEVVKAIFREKGNAIHVELRPSGTGLKLTVQFEEAFLALYGRYLAQAMGGENDSND